MAMSKSELKEVLREAFKEENEANKPIDHASHVIGCKDCYPKVLKKARATMKHQCSNCGIPLQEENITYTEQDCPNCGESYNREDVDEIEREGE